MFTFPCRAARQPILVLSALSPMESGGLHQGNQGSSCDAAPLGRATRPKRTANCQQPSPPTGKIEKYRFSQSPSSKAVKTKILAAAQKEIFAIASEVVHLSSPRTPGRAKYFSLIPSWEHPINRSRGRCD